MQTHVTLGEGSKVKLPSLIFFLLVGILFVIGSGEPGFAQINPSELPEYFQSSGYRRSIGSWKRQMTLLLRSVPQGEEKTTITQGVRAGFMPPNLNASVSEIGDIGILGTGTVFFKSFEILQVLNQTEVLAFLEVDSTKLTTAVHLVLPERDLHGEVRAYQEGQSYRFSEVNSLWIHAPDFSYRTVLGEERLVRSFVWMPYSKWMELAEAAKSNKSDSIRTNEDDPAPMQRDPSEEDESEPQINEAVREELLENEIRTWQDATGKFSVKARLVSSTRTLVVLRKEDGGDEIQIPLSRLSSDDRIYAKKYSAGATEFPFYRSSDQVLPYPVNLCVDDILKRRDTWNLAFDKERQFLESLRDKVSWETSAGKLEGRLHSIFPAEEVDGEEGRFQAIVKIGENLVRAEQIAKSDREYVGQFVELRQFFGMVGHEIQVIEATLERIEDGWSAGRDDGLLAALLEITIFELISEETGVKSDDHSSGTLEKQAAYMRDQYGHPGRLLSSGRGDWFLRLAKTTEKETGMNFVGGGQAARMFVEELWKPERFDLLFADNVASAYYRDLHLNVRLAEPEPNEVDDDSVSEEEKKENVVEMEPERELDTDLAKFAKSQLAESQRLGVPVEYEDPFGIKFILVPAGEFTMGYDTPSLLSNVKPATRVKISKSFYLASTELTNAQFARVSGATFDASTKKFPKIIDWRSSQSFLVSLNQQAKGGIYRLPTEAEWELAHRAGREDLDSELQRELGLTEGWYEENSGGRLHGVAEKKANPYGFYDMFGNVTEWTSDCPFDLPKNSNEELSVDPTSSGRSTNDSRRITRGGSFDTTIEGGFASPMPHYMYTNRHSGFSNQHYGNHGIRLVLEVESRYDN